jgi:hypothetical protein
MITNPTRQHALRGAPGHTSRPAGRVRNSVEHQAALAWRLTPRDRWIIAMLAEHRVLTATQITDMAFPSFRSGRQRLRELYQWSVLDRFQPFATLGSAPMHYVVAPAGAAVLAAAHGLDPRELGYRHDRALAVAHSLRLAHTVGVAEWFAALVCAARHDPTAAGSELEVWWSETRCARLFGDLVRPDGYGRWTSRGRRIEFFLEFDLGTEALTRVAGKLAGYAALAAATTITTPLLIWLPTARREAGARAALQRAWRDLDQPAAVPVATAAAGLLDPDTAHPSPADPVWLPLPSAGRPRDGNARLPLHRLSEAWPHLQPHLDDPAPQAEPTMPGNHGGRTGVPAVFPMPPAASPRGRAAPHR